jgi:predicted transcriptional regulator of viral defense system
MPFLPAHFCTQPEARRRPPACGFILLCKITIQKYKYLYMKYAIMKYLKFDDILGFLSRSGMGVFTVYDVAKLMHKPTGYASLLLSKSRKARRIERGRYYLDGTSAYEVASGIVYPSYVSLAAALQYYELIDQNVVRYSVITTKRHRRLSLENGDYEFITVAKRRFFGYASYGRAYIATPEKLFVDCLYFGIPAFSQVEASFAAALGDNAIDVGRLKRYALRMGSKALINRLGFLLELSGIESDEMLQHTYRSKYVKVRRDTRGKNRKWRVSYDR